jgi:mono/diheme cytochrome c family protein
MRLTPAFTLLITTLGVGAVRSVSTQDVPPIWRGVYTTAQAERGRSVVQLHCAECHQDDLSGGEGPALRGSTFMLKWETHTVERLFHKIRDTMPSPESDVTEREKLDSVAFILQQNGYPAGTQDLAETDGLLASLRIVPKGGVVTPRAGALVQSIGCLTETGPNQWTLTRSTDPQVTTLDPMSAEQKTSAAAASGSQSVQLLSVFPSPAPIKGHKAIAKGLFITSPSGPRINVMSLESLAPDCGK